MKRPFVPLVALLLSAPLAAACAGAPASPAATTVAPAATSAAPPSLAPSSIVPASPSAAASTDPALIGTWARIQSCEQQLAAFGAAGLLPSKGYQWVTANWVAGNPPPTPKGDDYCAGARPPIEHSHFFTADLQFGSRDENGNQVDDGDYTLKRTGTLTFPSHAREFGYPGEIIVGYKVDGATATFDVRFPAGCISDDHCTQAYGWALSAFFAGAPWHRSA